MIATPPPLRRILFTSLRAYAWGDPPIQMHVLECGHYLPAKGHERSTRRRCVKCKLGKPTDWRDQE